MCYHAEFGCCALSGVSINRVEPQNCGGTGTALSRDRRRGWCEDTRSFPTCVTISNLVVLRQGRAADSIEIRPSPHVLSCRNWSFYRSNGTSVIKEIRLKNLTPGVSPFMTTQGHRNRHRSIRYFLLTFHSNGPISYRFRDKRRFQSKIANFSHTPVY